MNKLKLLLLLLCLFFIMLNLKCNSRLILRMNTKSNIEILDSEKILSSQTKTVVTETKLSKPLFELSSNAKMPKTKAALIEKLQNTISKDEVFNYDLSLYDIADQSKINDKKYLNTLLYRHERLYLCMKAFHISKDDLTNSESFNLLYNSIYKSKFIDNDFNTKFNYLNKSIAFRICSNGTEDKNNTLDEATKLAKKTKLYINESFVVGSSTKQP